MPRPSRTLAAVHDASKTPDRGTQLGSVIPDPIQPSETSEGFDLHDLHVSIVVGTGLDFLLGNTVQMCLRASKLKGKEKLAAIEEAQRYLIQARRQAAGGAS